MKKILFMIRVLFQWIPSAIKFYFIKKKKNPIHVFFCVTDHYEPGTGGVSDLEAKARVDSLLTEYPKLADKHKDSEGLPPTRTWFIPPHYHKNYYLRDVVSLCEKGYGEIELHLHHGKDCPDTSENLRETIKLSVEEFAKFGIFGEEDGKKVYGFIHGDWALSNSRGNQFCGVNDEITILKETGCYADFTFPSPNEASPSQINTIFYAKDDPLTPKSHNTGEIVRANGSCDPEDLMVVQGPTYPYFRDGKLHKLRVSGDEIAGTPPLKPNRIDACVHTAISVKGKEDWVFVNMHTHGATDAFAVLGQEMDDIFTHLESKYNDGENYRLHYVTAREVYNLIKAVESGEECEDPSLYRNYRVSAPQYNSTPDISSASEELRERVARTYKD